MLSIRIRDLQARRRRLAGVVLAVALGVAFLSGALTFGATLSANFSTLFATASAGTSAVVRSTAAVSTGAGAARPPIPAPLLATVRSVPGVADAQPSITGPVTLLGADGKAVGGLGPPRSGGNWIADPALTPYRLAAGQPPRGLHQVVLNEGAARAARLRIGSAATVLVPAPVRVRVVGLATFGRAAGFGGATYVAFSDAAARRYLASGTAASRGTGGTPGQAGRVSAIEVSAARGVSPQLLVTRLDRVLPAGVQALSGAQLTAENLSDLNSEFLSSLKVILLVFAGIALLAGALVIASTFGILVAQRTRESALLRALGATRGQVLRGVLAEALAVGVTGSAVGAAAGLGLAELLKGLFDAAGFALPAGGLAVTGGSILVSMLTGIAVTIAVSLVPALRASRAAPLQALRDSAAEPGRIARRRTATGLVLLGAGAGVVLAGLARAGSGVTATAGLGALAVTAGVVALGPALAGPAARLAARPLAAWRGVAGTLAGRNAAGHPRRTAAAATSLMIGVAVVTLFTVYAASLRAADMTGVGARSPAT